MLKMQQLKKVSYLPLKKAKYTIGVKALTNLRMNVLKMSLSSKLLSVFGTSKKQRQNINYLLATLSGSVIGNKCYICFVSMYGTVKLDMRIQNKFFFCCDLSHQEELFCLSAYLPVCLSACPFHNSSKGFNNRF